MAGKGGGAWKVAYADFVTAMMAFFMVMWLVGQDQKIKKAVADYFGGPGEIKRGSRAPTRLGGAFDTITTGSLPHSEKVMMGRGREAHTPKREHGRSTKLVSDWMLGDDKVYRYWKQQAGRQRELAQRVKDTLKEGETTEQVAAQQLARQMKDEIAKDLFGQVKGIGQDLLAEAVASVNWTEVAEDLLTGS